MNNYKGLKLFFIASLILISFSGICQYTGGNGDGYDSDILNLFSNVDEFKNTESIIVYPNPIKSGNDLNIESFLVEKVELYNSCNNNISIPYTKGSNTLKLNIDAGVYWLKLYIREGIVVKKLIIY